MLKHRCISAALFAMALAGCQGRGLQPQSTSAATPATNDTIATVTSEPVAAEEQSSTTVETTSTTAEIIPTTVPVTRVRATPTTLAYVAPAARSGRCGGDLPPCWVMMRESGGDPTIWNRQGSGASGKWQFMPGTWAGYGGYAHAAYAPESVQDDKARLVWAGGAGCFHWSAC